MGGTDHLAEIGHASRPPRRAVGHLLMNSVRYTPADGTVHMEAQGGGVTAGNVDGGCRFEVRLPA
ncbi:MAG: hypothetical protein QOC94_3051 [Actinoplanes sp.]|jgi:signal transduction histidine kinase|nr:hypothetical protein [Actinoplanes sp.]